APDIIKALNLPASDVSGLNSLLYSLHKNKALKGLDMYVPEGQRRPVWHIEAPQEDGEDECEEADHYIISAVAVPDPDSIADKINADSVVIYIQPEAQMTKQIVRPGDNWRIITTASKVDHAIMFELGRLI